ncbi:MAG: 3-hydroxybenzoate-6-hydroxylase [Hyphomicrobiales bacterium]|nr:3-hydroxybenzoate-6-hydroxylase [Hyphomicrobiales bacterium]
MRDETILIVGGGIGGLCAALALGQSGWSIRVLEQAPQFGAIGYGIQLGPNVFPMLSRLGVAEAVRAASVLPGNVWMFDALTGGPVTRVRTDMAFRERFGAPYIVIHRVDLHNILVEACRKSPLIHLDEDASVTGYEDRGDHVVVSTRDGRTIEGAAVIGADGLRSRIRTQIMGESEPVPTGYVAHRTIVPIEKAPKNIPLDDVVLWAGPGFHIVHYPLRNGTIFNIVAVFETETYARKGDVEAYRAELQRTYAKAQPAMREMISLLDLERRWPIADRPPQRGWSKGRAVLMGDAAHATLQSLAQGAGMAMEDAVILGALIDRHRNDVPAAFPAFEKARIVRTARVQLESRAMWERFYHTGGVEAEVRNAIEAERSHEDVWQCLDWLYRGANVPGAPAGA